MLYYRINNLEKKMINHKIEIKRSDLDEDWAHSGIVEAGDFAFIYYCFNLMQ